MANTDRARKLLVRSALATSATIATFIGAQNLAMLDAHQIDAIFTPSPETAPVVGTSTPSSVQEAAPNIVIQHAAPSVIILRQSGQQTPMTTASSIQPPAAVEIAAPPPVIMQQPVVVQQPMMQQSHSSR